MSYNTDLQSHNNGLRDILAAVNDLPDAGSGETVPEVEQATPVIAISDFGKITATATQEAGKVEAGTKTVELQLNIQGSPYATDYLVPSRDPIIFNKGDYFAGKVEIAGDANLLPENIASGVTIFDVKGIAKTSGTTVELVEVEIYLDPNPEYLCVFSVHNDNGEPGMGFISGTGESNFVQLQEGTLIGIYAPTYAAYATGGAVRFCGITPDNHTILFLVAGDGYIEVF